MKTNCETKNGSETVRWLKSIFVSSKNRPHAAAACPDVDPVEISQPVPRKQKTVLVVDDDPVFLKATSMKLESEGYDVITASEGAEAIQTARRNKPDVLVLDVELTRDVAGVPWDGFSVISWLRRFEDLKDIPVVMATGGDAATYTRKAFSSGASAFFHKCMDPQMLVTLVSRSLQHPRLAVAGSDTSFQI
jgi:CheY-like chemotaxis protein